MALAHGGWLAGWQVAGAIDFRQPHGRDLFQRAALHAFEQHLRDGPAQPPAAAVTFETGTNVWRRQVAWPPASHSSDRIALYLRAGGRLISSRRWRAKRPAPATSATLRGSPHVGQPTRGG